MSLKTLIDSSLGSWTGPKSTVSAVALTRRQYYGSGKMNENNTPSSITSERTMLGDVMNLLEMIAQKVADRSKVAMFLL